MEVSERTDNRSYQASGDKAKKLGFVANRSIHRAVQDIYARFRDGYWNDVLTNPEYFNVYQK